MISFSNINKQYGRQLVFVDASFQLNPGEKVGLVGPNGSGKTTLFRMVVGEETTDEGAVSVPKKLTIGYFRQDVEEMQGRSVLDEAIAGSGRVGDLYHELEALQREMSDPDKADDMDRILDRFGHVQEEYEHLGGYALESQAREVLHGLGFKDDQIDGDVGALSGGWKMRVALARVLLGMPDVLLMDEPTNHLDIESIIWLEQFLKSFPGALLMTSHDREFMNRLVSKIAEIDGDRKSTRLNSSHVSTSYAVFCLKKKIAENPAVRFYAGVPIVLSANAQDPDQQACGYPGTISFAWSFALVPAGSVAVLQNPNSEN